jgi:hypothetical protein
MAILASRATTVLKENVQNSQCSSSSSSSSKDILTLREIVGDFGLALFSPLDAAFLPPREFPPNPLDEESPITETSTCSQVEERKSSHDELYIFNHELFPVQLAPEEESQLENAPRILTESMFHQIVNDAIPTSLRMYQWKRVFTITRDGDAFITMLEKCETYKNTLIALKTTSGHILGGFASEPWKDQDGYDKRHSYFGTGVCFLFSDFPKSSKSDQELSIYSWTGMNDYCQICEVDKQFIAMGGGEDDFGLVIEDSFLRGSTGHCATFGNAPLIPGMDGSFEIEEFEVWGMVPLFPTAVKSLSKKYSGRSMLRH